MAGKNHFCTHCGTHTWMEIELVDFLYDARDEYDVRPLIGCLVSAIINMATVKVQDKVFSRAVFT